MSNHGAAHVNGVENQNARRRVVAVGLEPDTATRDDFGRILSVPTNAFGSSDSAFSVTRGCATTRTKLHVLCSCRCIQLRRNNDSRRRIQLLTCHMPVEPVSVDVESVVDMSIDRLDNSTNDGLDNSTHDGFDNSNDDGPGRMPEDIANFPVDLFELDNVDWNGTGEYFSKLDWLSEHMRNEVKRSCTSNGVS
jgi:hypothetical protein